jgi:hypothetical protein
VLYDGPALSPGLPGPGHAACLWLNHWHYTQPNMPSLTSSTTTRLAAGHVSFSKPRLAIGRLGKEGAQHN